MEWNVDQIAEFLGPAYGEVSPDGVDHFKVCSGVGTLNNVTSSFGGHSRRRKAPTVDAVERDGGGRSAGRPEHDHRGVAGRGPCHPPAK